ncbi:TPA: DNA replication/repair protein RecF [Candidatus Gastranaerophilales bacterium HUM_9]|nr:MAG TPA: DNA replication/repair protein RecF [Candidatus Gastranaerophilales bacterium HUM_9]HBX35531.1 DNA replication/repair protein RecF [Cyanobacteria bacterium UBA11440]
MLNSSLVLKYNKTIMRAKHLALNNYRNCKNIELDFNNNKTLIIGKNAQGKTNILESIYFLSTLKSPRTSNIKEFVNFDKNNFSAEITIEKSNTEIELGIEYNLDKPKVLKVNGLKTTSKNYKGVLTTVLFSTQDLMLLRGSPQDRRSWLDSAISQIYPAHDERISKYNKIRIQKNNLLKEPDVNLALLDVFNEQLTTVGANIIYVRQKFLSELKKYAKTGYLDISKNEEFDLKYSFEEKDLNEIAKALKEELEERKFEEIARHQSCVGPHRDDIYFYLDNKDATKFASQGQQRTIVLAIKLAEIELIKNKNGESPILLLDDVLAELDDLRQNYLLSSISDDTQTIITSVDTLLFDNEFLRNVTIFKISNGEIIG